MYDIHHALGGGAGFDEADHEWNPEAGECTWVEIYTMRIDDAQNWGVYVIWRGPQISDEYEEVHHAAFDANVLLLMSVESICRTLNAFFPFVSLSARCVTGIPSEFPRWNRLLGPDESIDQLWTHAPVTRDPASWDRWGP